MTPDIRVSIAGVDFVNPIMTASGCCGYGEELANIFPLSKLGALVTKSITQKPRMGHRPPRTAETASGMLNAIGLANVGIDAFITDKLPWLEKQPTKVIVNVAGSSIREYVDVSARLADSPRVDMIELNISCPNVDKGGIEFGVDPVMTEKCVSEVRAVFKRPIIAKLGPNVTDITQIARAAEAGGADALAIMNSAFGTSVDIETWRPRLTNNRGGLTGPAIKPMALLMVDVVHRSGVKLPIIGIGGIANWQDVVEFMLFGATAVQVGTQLFVEPDAPVTIAAGLKAYMKQKKLATISDLVGKVQRW